MNLILLILASFFITANSNIVEQSNNQQKIISGKVLDSKTDVEIPFVNIYFLKSNQGTTTDENGDFSIQVNEKNLLDTLVFSSIGYKNLKIPVTEASKHSDKIFYLDEDVLALDEVTITSISAVEIIKKAMDKRKDNYGIAPHKLSGTYRITDQEDGAHVRLIEAAIDVYDSDYLKKDSRIVDYLAVRQSKDFRTFKWKQTKYNARNVDELLKPDFIKRPTRATHPNGFKKGFFYTLEKSILLNNEEVYVISATKNTAYQWPNYNAIFYVRVKDFAILRVDRDYTIDRPNWAKTPKGITRISKDQLILKYKEIDGKLYLNYFLWNLKGEVLNEKTKEKLVAFERNEELNIHGVSLEKKDKKISDWDDDIYKMTQSYDDSFWKNHPISNTQLFKDVSKELEEKESLNNQFASSDNKFTAYNPNKVYKSKQLKEDFSIFRKSLKDAHPSLHRFTTSESYSKQLDSVYRKLSKSLTEIEFYQLLTPLIANINCGHTQSRLSEEYYDFYKYRKSYFPLQTTFENEKLLISKNHISDNTLSIGSEIVKINGEKITYIKEIIDNHLPSDGSIQTSKDKIFGENFSELYSLYYAHQDSFSIELKTINGAVLSKNISAISYTDLISEKEKPNTENQYRIIQPETALLKVGTFMDSKDVDFKNWIQNSFADINRNNVKNLIIDLRDNTGGRDDYAVLLYSYIAQRSFQYHSYLESSTNNYSILSYTDQDETFNTLINKIVKQDASGRFILNNTHPTLGIHKVSQPNYDQKVIFLINGNTFSAAADFCAIAQQNKRGVFIGQETGGTAIGNTSNGELIVTLPNTGIRIKIPLFKVVNSVTVADTNRGVIPNYNTSYNRKDLIDKNDKDLETAIDIINEK